MQYTVRDVNKMPGMTHLDVEAGLGLMQVLLDKPWADVTVSASKAGEALRFEIGDTTKVTFSWSGGALSLVRCALSLVRSTMLAPKSSRPLSLPPSPVVA